MEEGHTRGPSRLGPWAARTAGQGNVRPALIQTEPHEHTPVLTAQNPPPLLLPLRRRRRRRGLFSGEASSSTPQSTLPLFSPLLPPPFCTRTPSRARAAALASAGEELRERRLGFQCAGCPLALVCIGRPASIGATASVRWARFVGPGWGSSHSSAVD